MALYFDQIRQEPQTHLLIIGVGSYPYLSGGAKEVQQEFDGAQLLAQLSSPPISAEAFYKTAIELHESNSWIKPLGSVEVLISPDPAQHLFEGKQLEPATIATIKEAYWNWRKRCDSDAANVAIFYFCGHGLDKAEHYLLAEDFGERPGNPWDGSFAFDTTRRAFFSCKAQTQLFFIDACRQLTPDMLKTQLPSNPIELPTFLAKDCRYNLTQKAAAANESAYGEKNQVSFYTKALIGALKGNAIKNGDWRISMSELSSKMPFLLQSEAPGEGYTQRVVNFSSDTTDIIRLTDAPLVKLNVTCDPDAALADAELSYLNLKTDQVVRRPPHVSPWEVIISAGLYKIEASFLAASYQSTSIFDSLMPPSDSKTINCVKL